MRLQIQGGKGQGRWARSRRAAHAGAVHLRWRFLGMGFFASAGLQLR